MYSIKNGLTENEIIIYNDGSLELNVPVSWDEETEICDSSK